MFMEGLGLLDRGVTVETDHMPENRTPHLVDCVWSRASVLLKQEAQHPLNLEATARGFRYGGHAHSFP